MSIYIESGIMEVTVQLNQNGYNIITDNGYIKAKIVTLLESRVL